MTQATLRTVTLKTVSNYSHAAERAVRTYRAGGHRLISAMQRSVDKVAERSADRVASRLVAVIQRASHQFGAFAGKGLDVVSAGTERAIELGKAGVTAQVQRVATMVEGVDNRVIATGMEAAVRLSMPGAQAALAVSERVAASAETMYGKVAGKQPTKMMRRAAKPTVAKKAKKAVAKVARATRKAVAEAVPAKPARARRATKAAAPVSAATEA